MDRQEIIDLLEKEGMWYSNQQPVIDQVIAFLKQQPTAGEWTKACRGMVEGIDRVIHPKSIPYESTRDRLIEACDRLDRAEAENKELLELCEEFMEIADDGSARFDDPEPGSIYLRAEAIIVKAKELRDGIKNPPPQADT